MWSVWACLGSMIALADSLLHVCEELISKQAMLGKITQGLQMTYIISTVNASGKLTNVH